MTPLLSIEQTLREANCQLKQTGSDSALLDANVLLCHVLGKPRSYLLAWPEKIVDERQQQHFAQLMERRRAGEPIAYITGEREFWSLPLHVSPSTLIPRPDTERLVEIALEKTHHQTGTILDLGTGTGAIALAIASELPHRNVIGVDYLPEAQTLATANAQRLSLHNATFLCGSWFEPFECATQFDLIVSNPPYIAENDPHLIQGDVRFEPKTALVAEDDGLADIKYIAQHSLSYLEKEGWLIFEHGYNQGAAVRQILLQVGYHNIVTEKDYTQHDRVTLGQLK